MDKNTKIKIRVPKALYESIKAEMVKQEGENPFAKKKPEMKEDEMQNEYVSNMELPDMQTLAALVPAGLSLMAVAKVYGKDIAQKLKGMLGNKGGVKSEAPAEDESGDMEEAVDINTLMEALKDVKKKKDAEKKKKEAEDKKKKEAEDKKKKEAEAKKKAAAAKKK